MSKKVFINCPFDPDYKDLLNILLFTIIHCGFEPVIASGSQDSGEIRLLKIIKLIGESDYSIHDISRIEVEPGKNPRFNLPFELGIDLGCKHFGSEKQKNKKYLVLEKNPYDYKKVISDLGGNDIEAHHNDPKKLSEKVRNWFYNECDVKKVPYASAIISGFDDFSFYLVDAVKKAGGSESDIESMSVKEYIDYIKEVYVKSKQNSS